MSLARMKNSIVAWKMPAVASGTCTADLRNLAAHIGDGEDQPREKDADRIETAEERNDDRGEAVAGGEAEIDLAELAHRLQMPASPAMPPLIISVDHTVREASKPP